MTSEILISLAGLALTMLVGYTHLLVRFAKMETKVDTLWTFMLRRAEAEAVIKGVASRNSPVEIKPEALKIIPPSMAEELRLFYRLFGQKMPDKDLMLEIEKRFGGQLVAEICTPHGFTEGTCLLIALAVAKQNPLIFAEKP